MIIKTIIISAVTSFIIITIENHIKTDRQIKKAKKKYEEIEKQYQEFYSNKNI